MKTGKAKSKPPENMPVGKCDFAMFDGWHWADLLSARPEFAEKCDFSKLDPLAWELLLIFRPQFADKCGWAALPRDSQAAILSRRTFHGWTGLLRYILTESRDKALARYVERKNWAGLHPYATGAGVTECGEAFCRLELANSRGRRVGDYEMLFKPDGRVSDYTYHMD